MITLTIAVGLLLVASAFTSGTETAMTGASPARIRQLARAGDRGAELVGRLLARKEALIGSLLLGNNLFNVLATALAADILIQLFGEAGIAYATLLMTALLVIFAEVMPKTYAIRNPERMARFIAPAAWLLVRLLTPATRIVQWVVDRSLGLFGVTAQPEPLSSAVDALRGTIELHAEEGAVPKHERDMLGGILDLAEVEVRQIMTHRQAMETIDAGRPPAQILAQVVASAFSRFPVWRGDPDRIIGVLHAKDLLGAVRERGRALAGLDVAALCGPASFVPDTTPLREQLIAFRRRRQHLALVVDEYGDLEGLVTLEDVIEEIVGEIADEKDVEAGGIELEDDGAVVASGWVAVRDLNRRCDWRLPDADAATVAGLALHAAQRIPEAGENLAVDGYRFEILRRERNRILLLRIIPPPAADEG